MNMMRVLTPCCDVAGYHRFRGPCFFHLLAEELEAKWVVGV